MTAIRIVSFCLILTSALSARQTGITLNDMEYFEKSGLNVMVFHDYYPEGHQGGVSIIQNGERTAANGDLRLEPAPGQWSPVAKFMERKVYPEQNEITARLMFPDSSRIDKGANPIDYPDLHMSYTIRVVGEENAFRIIVDLDKPLEDPWIGRVGFNLELFPGLLFGKSYYMDDSFGLFTPQANGPLFTDAQNEIQMKPMAEGHLLSIAPESDTLRCLIQSPGNTLQLIDGRGKHNNGWFIVRSLIARGATRNAVEWIVTPSILPNWKSAPVIHISQVGYHPKQKKTAVIEIDRHEKTIRKAALKQIQPDGSLRTILESKPDHWGPFLRYEYFQFDFTSVKEPGLYVIEYDKSKTGPFQISTDVYRRDVWQPTLEYYLPVQMCHMKVMEGYRVWHGLCHMDDALMAPVNHIHFDSYRQGPSTLTSYKPYDPVPGLNVGGWHDAGDYDLRVESQAGTVQTLALIYELFHVDHDATLIDQENHLVEIHIPDGAPDVLQQIEHGVETILSGYRAFGRLYRGIICPTLRQYVLLGDGSTMTDNRVYDSGLKENETQGDRSGKMDDRWVFTEENPFRELQVAASLAAASRVLKGYNDALSAECLEAALALWKKNKSGKNPSKIDAAVELLITTGNPAFKNYLLGEKESIARFVPWNGWMLGRALSRLDDPEYAEAVRKAMVEYHGKLESQRKETPFGVPYKPNIWGAGWDIQRFGLSQYFLHTEFPDIFTMDGMLDALNFVLGCHPGSNTASFVSGVGSKSVMVAYGVNRADWSYIPGGSVSGTALIRPDFPELKVWPYFWQQTEYVMGGGATNFMFLVLAADQLLNQ